MVRGLVIDNRWTVGDRLGAGSFGQVHVGTDMLTSERVAIKMESRYANEQTLSFERKVYKKLGMGGKFFPEILYYGTIGDYNVMVMQILGPSLEDLFHMCGRKFSLKTITMIAIQMIKRLRHIHKSDYIHRDIKPDNICVGTNALDGTLFPVDFGLAKRFKDSDRRHMDIKTGKGMMGTVRYASLHAHDGIELSRRDDLEALAYVLAYFIRGKLPWQGFNLSDKYEKYQRVHEEKLKWSTNKLFENAPKQFIEFFNHIESLEFKDKPDYDKLENLFNSVMVEKGYTYDLVFDWMVGEMLSQSSSF
ncbi:casein kinase I delta [Fennellomyces sp. T-0311]|nr:casein kinase I delta [Fennellomyces sp. T-0311]